MNDILEAPSVIEYLAPSQLGGARDQGYLMVNVGARSYFFEKDKITGEWLYVRNIPTAFSDDDDEDKPFDPSEWR